MNTTSWLPSHLCCWSARLSTRPRRPLVGQHPAGARWWLLYHSVGFMVTTCSLRLPDLDQKTRRKGLEHPSKQSRCMWYYVEILGFTLLSRESESERERARESEREPERARESERERERERARERERGREREREMYLYIYRNDLWLWSCLSLRPHQRTRVICAPPVRDGTLVDQPR